MKLYFKKTGTGNPIIILHGLYGSSDNWYSIAKALEDKYTVYLVDARNHGHSPHNPIHTYPTMASDTLKLIEGENIIKPIIIGHSMGGKTAMYLAAEHADILKALVVVDISPVSYANDSSPTNHTQMHGNIISALRNLDLSIVKTRQDADHQLSKEIPSIRVRQFLLKNLERKKDGSYFWLLNLEVLSNMLNEIIEGIEKANFIDELKTLPTLFIRGGNSDYITDNDIEEINKIFPVNEIVTVEGSGHWVHAEKPEEFMRVLKKFLSEIK